jgi:hypothetical protein
MKRYVILAMALSLGGCASSIMEGYVGQPLQAAMVRYGPPDAVFDMPDGRRAFQWEMANTTALPATTVTNTNFYAPPGAFRTATSTSTTYGGGFLTNTCRYTMYAEYRSDNWIFTGFERPSLSCE